MSKPFSSERRTFMRGALALGLAGATGAGGFWWGERHEARSHIHRSPKSFSCFGPHQAGITTEHQPFSIMAAFDVLASTPGQLQALLRTITDRVMFLSAGGTLDDADPKLPPPGSGMLGKNFLADGLTITLGVGASLFNERFGLATKKPLQLQTMQGFPNDKLQPEWCDGDLSIQICAFTPETCQNALRDLLKTTARLMVIRWSMEGFLPKSEPDAAPRNLLGFRDGSANPGIDDKTANEVIWTGVAAGTLNEPAWAKNGSYQAVRLIRHFVEFWDRTPLQEQQTIFGREKYSGAPLGQKHEHDAPDFAHDPNGKVIPHTSHMRLANDRGPESAKHLLFRRPYDYSRGLAKSGQLDTGLIFIAYQASLKDGFLFVQGKLNAEPLEEYISPFGGGYFYVLPGFEKGQFLGQGLFA